MDLKVQPRAVLGKKVAALRRQGTLPIHVFGPGYPSEALQANTHDVQQLLHTSGRNALVKLIIEGQNGRAGRGTSYDVMVKDVSRDPVTGELLHVDFYRAVMDRPVEASVAIVLAGTSPAVRELNATLVHGASAITVTALPGKAPSGIEIDVSVLREPHQALHARDLVLPEGVTLASDPDQVLVTVVPPRGAEEIIEAPAAAAEEAQAAEAATPENEAPAAEQSEES